MKKICASIGLLIFSVLGCSRAAEPLTVGAAAPQITAKDENGADVDFNAVYQKGITLVYFYPKADTPGCTAEACSLRDAFVELSQKGVQVLGVSADSSESQKKFKDKYQLPFTLIADQDHRVADAFAVPHTLGFDHRQSFLIKDGKIIWLDFKASTKEQAADVLKNLPK